MYFDFKWTPLHPLLCTFFTFGSAHSLGFGACTHICLYPAEASILCARQSRGLVGKTMVCVRLLPGALASLVDPTSGQTLNLCVRIMFVPHVDVWNAFNRADGQCEPMCNFLTVFCIITHWRCCHTTVLYFGPLASLLLLIGSNWQAHVHRFYWQKLKQ